MTALTILLKYSIFYNCRCVKIPSVQKAVATRATVKKEPLDKPSEYQEPLHEKPDIIELDDDEQQKMENVKHKKRTEKLKVSLETITFKPVVPLEIKRPQTARRGRGFHSGCEKIHFTGKTSDITENRQITYNELEAAKCLAGMKGPQPKDGYIHKLRSSDSKDVEEIKGKDIDSTGQTAVTEVKEKTEKEILQKEEEVDKDIQEITKPFDPPKSELSEIYNVNAPEAEVVKIRNELEAILDDASAVADCESCRDTLKSILAILQTDLSGISEKDIGKSDNDTGISKTTDNTDTTHVVYNQDITHYDVKLKVDSDSEEEISEIKEIVSNLVTDVVRKINDEVGRVARDNTSENKPLEHEPDSSLLPAAPMDKTENIKIKHQENIETECTDNSNITSEYDVQNKSDETPAQLCPIHGNKSSYVDIVPEDVAVVDTGQPPGYVKEDVPTVVSAVSSVYVNADTESNRENRKNVTFNEEVAICEDDGHMKKTCEQLDDTLSFSEEMLLSDEGVHEKSSVEEMSVSTGHVVAIPGESCKVGEIPPEDEDEIELTPPCSQMPRVDPYKKRLLEGDVSERYAAFTNLFYSSFWYFTYLLILHLSCIIIDSC